MKNFFGWWLFRFVIDNHHHHRDLFKMIIVNCIELTLKLWFFFWSFSGHTHTRIYIFLFATMFFFIFYSFSNNDCWSFVLVPFFFNFYLSFFSILINHLEHEISPVYIYIGSEIERNIYLFFSVFLFLFLFLVFSLLLRRTWSVYHMMVNDGCWWQLWTYIL